MNGCGSTFVLAIILCRDQLTCLRLPCGIGFGGLSLRLARDDQSREEDYPFHTARLPILHLAHANPGSATVNEAEAARRDLSLFSSFSWLSFLSTFSLSWPFSLSSPCYSLRIMGFPSYVSGPFLALLNDEV